MISLSIRLLRRHWTLYAGSMATLAATVVLATAQAALAEGIAQPGAVRVAGLTPEEIAAQQGALTGLLSVLSGLAIGISGFLMWSAIKQVVSFRHQELALMRLLGASRWRLAGMILLECFVMGSMIALPSAIVGAAVARPLFAGLQAIGFFGRSVEVEFGFGLGPALLVALSGALVAGVAGLAAARSATRGNLVSAINPLTTRMPWSEVAWRVALVLAGLVCVTFIEAKTLGPNLVLAVPLLAVVPLLAISPLLIPAGSWLIGRCVGLFAPGPGLLAAQRASRDRLRYARLAAPAVVAVGVLGGFLVANAPDEQMRAEAFHLRVAASVVVSAIGVSSADQAAAALQSPTNSVARLASVKRVVSGKTQMLYVTDAVPLGQLMTLKVTAGSLADVAGVNVASSVSGTEVGDDLAMLDRAGKTVTVHVVATLDDSLLEGVFIDWAEMHQFVADPTSLPVQIFANQTSLPAAIVAIDSAGVQADVTDRAGYIRQLGDTRKANTYRSNVGLFGTIYLMSVISLVQAAVSGSLARRREFAVLRAVGVSRSGLLVTVGTEVLIVQLVAGLLVAAVLVALGLRFAADNGTSAAAAVLSVLPTTVVAFGSVALVALVAQLTGAALVTSDRLRIS